MKPWVPQIHNKNPTSHLLPLPPETGELAGVPMDQHLSVALPELSGALGPETWSLPLPSIIWWEVQHLSSPLFFPKKEWALSS